MIEATRITPDQLSENKLERFKELILERTGLVFRQPRVDTLLRGICVAAERTGIANLDEYYQNLKQGKTDHPEWDNLICELTVGETYFFRNQSHIEALRQHILPELIQSHQSTRRLRIWSAGCATGEESYTLSILLHQLLPYINDWNIQILATDINRGALQHAKAANYRAWSFRSTPANFQLDYFKQDGDTFKLLPHISRLVAFAYLNLAENSYPSLTTGTNAMDLIMCRNVAIYLPESINRAIAKRFFQSITAKGWLIMGASETNMDIYREFKSHNLFGATVYQKITGTGALSLPVKLKKDKTQPINGKSEPALDPIDLHRTPPPLIESLAAQAAQEPGVDEQHNRIYQEAMAKIESGHSDIAQALLLECIQKNPESPHAYYQIARLQADAGHLARAQHWLQQTLNHDPLMAEAHYTLGLVYQEQGEFDTAIFQFNKILYLVPEFILAHFGLSILYQKTGQNKEAERHRSHAIRLVSQLPPDAVLFASDGLTAARALKMMTPEQ
jgi:chemotaxis protein methyltransferase CheR